MGFKNILSSFVEFDETPKPNDVATTVATSTPLTTPSNYYENNNNVSNTTSNSEGVLDKLNYFKGLINEKNLPGPDIKEVIDSVSDLEDLPNKYATVWKILSKNGLTWEKIEESYKVYLDVINKSDVNFKQAIKDAETSDITNSKTRITEITNKISEYNVIIQNLEKEKQSLASKIAETETKLINNSKDFETAKNQYINLLTNTYNNLKTIK
jgi:vacuolar-type H+-ATPase subunit I/STV1